MTLRRWSTLVSALVFAVLLATADSARAQYCFDGLLCFLSVTELGFPSVTELGFPSVTQIGFGYGPGAAVGISPLGYDSFGGASFGNLGGFGAFPLPGYGLSNRQTPQTTTSFQPIYSTITLLPGRNGSMHRVRRRH